MTMTKEMHDVPLDVLIDKYKSSIKECQCVNHCRVDWSALETVHHLNCRNFVYEAELLIMQDKLMLARGKTMVPERPKHNLDNERLMYLIFGKFNVMNTENRRKMMLAILKTEGFFSIQSILANNTDLFFGAGEARAQLRELRRKNVIIPSKEAAKEKQGKGYLYYLNKECLNV